MSEPLELPEPVTDPAVALPPPDEYDDPEHRQDSVDLFRGFAAQSVRTLEGALNQAHAESLVPSEPPPDHWRGLCQKFVRTCWGVGALWGSAASAWEHADFRHTTGTPPPGAPIFWTGGSQGFGHVALSTGNGNCWSTDILRRGYPDHVSIALIDNAWGNLHRVGWSEDINEVQVIFGFDPSDPGGEVIDPPTHEEEDDMPRYISITGEPADPNTYGYTDAEFWVANDEEVSAFGSPPRVVNARQRDVIKSRVLSIGRARAETPITDADLTAIVEAARPMVRREATDADGRTFQAWIGGQTNQEHDADALAAIKAIGARDGVLGDLFTDA